MAQRVPVLPPRSQARAGGSSQRVWLLGLAGRDRGQPPCPPDNEVPAAQNLPQARAARCLTRQQRDLPAVLAAGPGWRVSR